MNKKPNYLFAEFKNGDIEIRNFLKPSDIIDRIEKVMVNGFDVDVCMVIPDGIYYEYIPDTKDIREDVRIKLLEYYREYKDEEYERHVFQVIERVFAEGKSCIIKGSDHYKYIRWFMPLYTLEHMIEDGYLTEVNDGYCLTVKAGAKYAEMERQ